MWKALILFSLLATACWSREIRDLEFARPGGTVLTLDAWLPDDGKPRGAVILVHGGGWEAGDKRTYIRPWFETLTKAGIPWFTINYRLAPQHPHPAAVEDIEAAVQWVRLNAKQYRVDPKRIVLMGESAGGHLAALVALRKRVSVAGLVSFYGIHDISQWKVERGELPRNISLYLPHATPESMKEASPITYLQRGSVPMLLVHGTADKGVPWKQSEALCKAASRVGVACELLLIEGAPHGVENWEAETKFQLWKPAVVKWLRPFVD